MCVSNKQTFQCKKLFQFVLLTNTALQEPIAGFSQIGDLKAIVNLSIIIIIIICRH